MMMTEDHQHTNACYWDLRVARWVCAPAERPLVDTRDMLVVHTALLREFRLAPHAVRRVGAGDRRAARTVDRHLGFVADLLHHHHQGEDTLLWPVLRGRLAPQAVEALDRAQAQHAELDAALGALTGARSAWVVAAAEEEREALAVVLERVHRLLADHLELEESVVLPLAAAHLTEAEWHAVGEAAVASMRKPDLALSFGMFAYEGDPHVLKAMLETAPAVPRVVLPRVAPRLYARRARAVHGTARP